MTSGHIINDKSHLVVMDIINTIKEMQLPWELDRTIQGYEIKHIYV